MILKPNIALIGFMASGKSTLGALLSNALNMGFFDFDSEIQKNEGKSISEIFSTFGEPHFRHLEHETCKKAAQLKGYVIATGGGVVLNPENINLLKKSCTLIYLSAKPNSILLRAQNNNSRPLLAGGDKLDKIQTLLSSRKKFYEEYANIILDTNDKSENECLQELIDVISIHISASKAR